jgi:CubicO group peptidase (beta-lactamase class C family)
VQEGRLTLDDDVNRWLTRWRVPAHEWAAESPVTLRRLLSHTAGLTVHGFPGYAAGTALPTVEQVLAGVPPANTGPVVASTRPGAEYRYSGGGTTVAQLLVEEISGVAFAAFMEERVLRPLGMTSSTYAQPLPAAWAPRAATAHRQATGPAPIPGRFHSYPEMAAAGLWTTPSDLARWILAVQRSLAGDTTGPLQPWLAREMVAARPGRHGLGPSIEGEAGALRFGHGGANAGFRGVFVGYLDGGRGAVILTNADAGATVASELMLAIAAEYGWPGVAAVEIAPVVLAAASLRAYAGDYGTPEQPLQVRVEVPDAVADAGAATGESLFLVTPDGVRREVIAVGDDRFLPPAGGGPIVFERGDDGAVAALRVVGLRLPRQ